LRYKTHKNPKGSYSAIFDDLCFRSFYPIFSCGPRLTTRSPSMHPSRHPTSPTDAQSPTRHGESSSDLPPTYSSQTSLPSIRQLHPYLPLSSLSQHPTSSGESSGYNYPPFAQQLAQPEPQILGARRSSEAFGSLDSDGDDAEQRHGPPKKKRRRQPLSCTGQSIYPVLVHCCANYWSCSLLSILRSPLWSSSSSDLVIAITRPSILPRV
jgi:hypothetical protein